LSQDLNYIIVKWT